MLGTLGILAGGLLGGLANSRTSSNMSSTAQREINRQQEFRNQGFDKFQSGLAGQSAEQANIDISKGADTREALYNFVNSLSTRPGQDSPTGRDLAHLKLRGKARGRLGGYSDWALSRLIRNIRTQDELNKISNFAGGTASVFPARMDAAQHSNDELAFWGQLLGAGGQGLGGGGLSSLFGGGKQPTSVSMGYNAPGGGPGMFGVGV